MSEVRLVDANALKDEIKNRCNICDDKDTAWCEHCCSVNDWEDYIDNAPTVSNLQPCDEREKGNCPYYTARGDDNGKS